MLSRDVRLPSRSQSSKASPSSAQHAAVSLCRLPTGTTRLLEPQSLSYAIFADQYLADFREIVDQPRARHAPTITR